MIEVLVLVGGKGTRLKSVSGDTPKPLVNVSGKPFLYWILRNLKKQGVKKVVLSAGYRAEDFKNFINDYADSLDLNIYLSIETHPLGTGGGILNAYKYISGEDFFVLNGDSICSFDINRMLDTYLLSENDICCGTCFVENVSRYGTVDIVDGKISAFNEKGSCGSGLINSGVYILNKRVFSYFSVGACFSFEKEVLEKNVNKITVFPLDGYFIDIGVPEDFYRANIDFSNDILSLNNDL